MRLPSVLLLFASHFLFTATANDLYPIRFGYAEDAELEITRCALFYSSSEISPYVIKSLQNRTCYALPYSKTNRTLVSDDVWEKMFENQTETADDKLKETAFWNFKLATYKSLKYSEVEQALDLFGVPESSVNGYFRVHLYMRYEIYSSFNYTIFANPAKKKYALEVCGTKNPTRFYGHAYRHYSFGTVTNNGLVYRYRDNEQIFLQNELSRRLMSTKNCTLFNQNKMRCEKGKHQYDPKILNAATIKTIAVKNGVFVRKVEDKRTFVATSAKHFLVNSGQLIQLYEVPEGGRFLIELPKRWSAEVGSVRFNGTSNTFNIIPIESGRLPPLNHGEINQFQRESRPELPVELVCKLHETVPFAVALDNLVHFFRGLSLVSWLLLVLTFHVIASSTFLAFLSRRRSQQSKKIWSYEQVKPKLAQFE